MNALSHYTVDRYDPFTSKFQMFRQQGNTANYESNFRLQKARL